MILNMETNQTVSRGTRFAPRMSLLLRTLLIGVIPILLLTAVHLVLNSRSNTENLAKVMEDGAKQVAISVGSTVNRETFAALNQQLAALTQQPNIAFIYVQTEVTEDFKVNSRFTDRLDLIVIKAIHDYANQLSDQALLWSDDAAGYDHLLEYKRNTFGGEVPRGVQALFEKHITHSSGKDSNLFQVSQIGVYETENGRLFGTANKEKAQILITIGMLADQNVAIVNTQNKNLLLYGALFASLSIVISVFFTRSISVPILALIKAANDMSLGKLDQKIDYAGNDEIGQLAQALERLRTSLDIFRHHH
jgi:HAMP domain-containing protein